MVHVASASAQALRDHVNGVAEFAEFDDCRFFPLHHWHADDVQGIGEGAGVLFASPPSNVGAEFVMDDSDVSPTALHDSVLLRSSIF